MYDTIIIGQDLSSLIAALTSARLGMKTILITEGCTDFDHKEGGYAFPIDPAPLSGFGEEQTVLHLLKKLHLSPDKAPRFILMNPAFQVILPSHRIDLFHDRRELIDEMTREFPQLGQEIKRFYYAVSKTGELIESWIGEDSEVQPNDFRKIFRRLARLPAAIAGRSSLMIQSNGNVSGFRRVIEAQIAILSHLDITDGPFPLSAAYLFSLPERGVFYPLGGRNAWMNWLRKEFIDTGGIQMDGCSVMRIDTKPEIVIDLQKSGAPITLRGKKLIVSAQWEKLNLLLLNQKYFRKLVRRLHSIRPNAYPFCLHIGVHEGGLPERLAPYAVVIRDESRPATDLNLVFLETSLPEEKDRAPEGRRAVNAKVLLKDSPLLLADLELKKIATTVMDSLEGFLPFLRDSIDYVNIEKSIALSRQYQEIVSQKYRTARQLLLGMNTFSPHTPLSDVFLTGAILHAGLGFEGEILSGMDAAFLAGEKVPSHG
jgi:phytoene dehydrogenase-like protein